MDKKIYDNFIQILEVENKEKAVLFVIDLLEKKQTDLPTLYLELLTPALNDIHCTLENKKLCIWKEHVRSAIITTIIGVTYPYVIKSKRANNGKKVIVACPTEEYHEIGALIATQLFTLAGFDTHYIGANTPIEQIQLAVETLKAEYVALSVTNYYNAVVTKELVGQLKETAPALKIIIGGQAFDKHDVHASIYHDYHLNDYQDILRLALEVEK